MNYKDLNKEQLIEEIKRLQEENNDLKNQQSNFLSKFHLATDTLIIVNKDGIIYDINHEQHRDKVVGKSAYEFVNEEHRPTIINAIKNVFEKGSIEKYEIIGYAKKGTTAIYSSRVAPMFQNGKINFALILTTDITAQKEIEEKIKNSEERFKKLSEATTEGIIIHENGVIKELNEAFCKTLGYEMEELLDTHVFNYMGPESQETFSKNVSHNYEQPYELLVTKKDGSKIWCEVSAKKIIVDDKSYRVGTVRDITNRKKIETALKNSEERFKKLTEATTEAIAVHNDGIIIQVNRAFCELFGYTEQEVLNTHVLNYSVPQTQETVRQKMREKSEVPYEGIAIKKDGSKIFCEVVAREMFYDGKKLRVVGIRDITERKNFEEALKRSELQYRLLFSKANDAIFIMDEDIFVDCNEKTLEMFGCTKEEIVGHPPYEFSPEMQPDGKKSFEKAVKRINAAFAGEPQFFYWKHSKKSGKLFDAEVGLNVFELENKKYLQAIVRDITERKIAERKILENEEKYRLLFDKTPLPLWLYDFNTLQILAANKAAEDLYGYTTEEFMQLNLMDIRPEEEKQRLLDHMQQLRTGNMPISGKLPVIWKHKKKNGEIIDVEITRSRIELEGSSINLSLIKDVTEIKKIEKALIESRESYKNLVDQTPDGIFIHTNGKIVFANPAALKMFKVKSLEDIADKSIFDYLLPEYYEEITDRIKKMIKGEQVEFMQVKTKLLDDSLLDIEVKSVPVVYQGEPSIQVVMHDVSVQKQIEKEQLRAQIAIETNRLLQEEIQERIKFQKRLTESQKYIQNIIESSLDMISACDMNGNIIEFNHAAQRIFGYAPHEIIGKATEILFFDKKEEKKIAKMIRENENGFSGEVTNLRKNGEKFTSYLTASLLRNQDGVIVGSMGVSRDVSQYKRDQEKIIHQAAKINAIFKSSSHLIYTVNKDFMLTSFNENAVNTLFEKFNVKIQENTNILKYIGQMLGNESTGVFEQGHKEALLGKPKLYEARFIDKNNEIYWLESYLNPIFLPDGRIEEVSYVTHDVTEKKIAERQLLNSLNEKEILLKEVHHRVKNNLQVISSILSLQSSYVKDDYTLNMLKESQNRIKSMSFIHETLYQTKDFSKINFSDYILNLSKNLIHTYRINTNFVDFKYDGDLVYLNLDVSIPCGLIVNELLSNALKYAFPNNRKGEIEVKLKKAKKNQIVLTVADNGIGLPKDFNYKNTDTLGFQLFTALSEQISGIITHKNNKPSGTIFSITFTNKIETKKS